MWEGNSGHKVFLWSENDIEVETDKFVMLRLI